MATKIQVTSFISMIAPIAQQLSLTRDKWILPSVTIAQAACESNWGTSKAMASANGLFGFKVGSGSRYGNAWSGASYSTKTKEYYGHYVTIRDNFRAYTTVTDSVVDYMDLLCGLSRYAGAVNQTDTETCITAIKNGGYATSPTYIKTIMTIINAHNLTQYDHVITRTKPIYIVGKNYILQNDMYIRDSAAGNKKGHHELSANAKLNAFKDDVGCGILKKGTVVTVKEVQSVEGATWVRIPSGWICGVSASAIVYLK